MNQVDVDTGNLVMIVERSNSRLNISKSDDGYMLEGIAAVFGEENNNQRIYEEKEYLPHLDYLKKKIAKRGLMGELDHPEKFDVMLKNASHIVESLDYDAANRQLKIKVRLLDTPNGRIAKNLVDADIPISISSRAAGIVENDKTVKIKRIFTYDLVADPGFDNAQLTRVNENLGYGNLDNVGIYDISKNEDLYNNYIKEMGKEGIKIDENSTESEMDTPNFVKVEELHNYSLIIKKELGEIKEALTTLQESAGPSINEEEMTAREARVSKLENYVNYLADNLDRSIQYQEYIADNLDQNIEYGKYVAENLDTQISYSEYLAENLDRGISYSEYVAEAVEKGINYSEYLAENLDKGIDYSEYLAEKLDKGIGYTEYLAEHLDSNISTVDELNEKFDFLNEAQEYYDAKGKKNKKKEDEDEYIEDEDKKEKEEKAEESISAKYDNLSSKVDDLLESVKKQKTDEIINESEHRFFRLLSNEKRKEFLTLQETEKEKVTEAIEKVAYTSEEDIVQIWESALTIQTEIPLFISEMPEDIEKIWENLDPRAQEAIIAQSDSYNLDTSYQIKHFWNTRNLKDMPVLEKLNENETPETTPNEGLKASLRGYNNDYVNSVMEGLDKYQSRTKKENS